MANKNRKEPVRTVYNTNKIQQAWHYLQVTNWGRRTKK